MTKGFEDDYDSLLLPASNNNNILGNAWKLFNG